MHAVRNKRVLVLLLGILVLSIVGVSILGQSQQVTVQPAPDKPGNTTTAGPTTGTGNLVVKDNLAPEVRFGTASTIDYVDSNYAGTYGSVVNFANMQSADSSYATLSEQAIQFTLLEYKNVWTPWPGTGWQELNSPDGHTDFEYLSTGGYDGATYAAVFGDPETIRLKSGILQSPVYDMYMVWSGFASPST
ncbi:MAG: hypothetical protein ACTSVT_10165 [Candidatus Thorarchaeota archaeon]